MFGVVLKSVLTILGCLVAADIAGVVVCTIFEILPLRGVSVALAYAIWAVFGIFCGLYAYNFAGRWSSPKGEPGDWSARPGAGAIGTVVMIVALIVIAALAALFYALFWSKGPSGDEYVPDSISHSIVFLVAVTGAIIAGRFFLMPTADKPA